MQDKLEVIKEKIKSYGLNRENMRELKKWFLNDVMNDDLLHLILDSFSV